MKHKQLAALAAAGLAAAGLGIGVAHANSSSLILTSTPRSVETIAVRQGNWTLTGSYDATVLDASGFNAVSVNCSLQVRPFGSTAWSTLDSDRVWVGGDLQDATAMVFISSDYTSTGRFNARVACTRGGVADGVAFISSGGSLSAAPN
jgi:hypothetical protein